MVNDYPVLTEKGREPIRGVRLEYNFKTRRGKILEGRTHMEPGYYHGQEITKVGERTLFIRKGCFTTCDLDRPHYYFCTSKMRLKVNKVGVAQPIVMYIADIPVMAVPFGIFPLQKGRHSGIIMPVYGENNYGGRYLERFGFYWAASQYWDATLLANFYEKTGIVYSGEVRYKKRYAFNGNIRGRYAPRDVITGARKQRWELSFHHNQTIGRTITINGSGSFVSDRSFRRQYYNDIERRLDQSLTTSLVIRKTWPSSRNSLNLSMRRTENLQTGQIDYEIPNVTFSMPTRNLVRFKSGGGKKRSWYHDIRYSISSNLLSRGSRVPTTTPEGLTRLKRTQNSGWQHRLNLSFSRKILKYLSTQQSLSFREVWVPDYLQYHWV
ncbi:LPS-assembly protein LptD, partial [Candidatus Parcubacteria bacterium]